jgi:hypothetical protein
MAFSLTGDQVKAYGRHVGTAAASVIGTLAAVKVISGGDAASLQASLDQISHGVAEIVTAVSAIAITVSGAYAAISANPLFQLLRGSRAVSADPKLAAQVPEATQKEMVKATDALPTTTAVVSTLADDIPSSTVVTPDQAVIKQ